MRLALACAMLALTGCGAVAPRPAPAPEPVLIRCPSIAPPALYALPPARTDFIRPDDYAAERRILEGRHAGFGVRLDTWRAAWARCEET